MDMSGYMEIKGSQMACSRWLGRTLGLPRRYAEGIPRSAGIDPKTKGDAMDDSQIHALHGAAGKIINDVISGNHSPVIMRDQTPEAAPVRLVSGVWRRWPTLCRRWTRCSPRTYWRGDARRAAASPRTRRRGWRGAGRAEEGHPDRAGQAEAMGRLADSMYVMLSSGILRLDTEEAAAALAENGATLVRERGVPALSILDEKIKISLDAPLQSTASVLYGASKRQAAAVPSIQDMISKTQRKIEKAARTVQAQQGAVAADEVRKRNWFERYRWFYASDGTLAVGGRDAPSNSAVVRKHMEPGDRVFHAEIYGSPFFILKGGGSSAAALEETAQATVCFSRVWREAMHGSGAYWVDPDQVKKSAPSGQYLPKGSFTIEGRRNFVRASGLKLGIGMMERDDDTLLACGPPDAVAKHAHSYVIIEPGGSDASAAAKAVRRNLLDMGAEGAGLYSIDDYIRALPPGRSRVVSRNNGA